MKSRGFDPSEYKNNNNKSNYYNLHSHLNALYYILLSKEGYM